MTATTFFTITAAPATVATALASIYDELEIVWNWTGAKWLMNDPDDPVGSADPDLGLAALTVNEAYWIQVTAACTLNFADGSTKALTAAWWNIAWH